MRKEVNDMRYEKPKISDLANAVTVIQASQSLLPTKEDGPTDGIKPDMTTVSAYVADE